MRSANLALRFVLELCALAAFAYWGSQVSGSLVVNVVVAITAPLLAAAAWGVFVSPRGPRRLRGLPYLIAELVFFGLAAGALAASGHVVLGLVFGLVACLNLALVHLLGEGDDSLSAAQARRCRAK
jgi:hypothetical protein